MSTPVTIVAASVQYRLLLRRLKHGHLYPLLRRHPHQLRRHRLQCRKPRLQPPRALVANCNTRDTRRCPGGLVAKPEQCAKHRRSLLTTTDYCRRWTMRLWCPCLRIESQSMTPFGIVAHRRTYLTCQPHMRQIFILLPAFLRWRRTACGNMAAIYEQGVPRSTARRYLCAGIATSRERDQRENGGTHGRLTNGDV